MQPSEREPEIARTPWAIVGAALALRWWLLVAAIVVSGNQPRIYEPDSTGYVALATSLVNGDAFAQQGEPELYRTPGYPVFLMLGVELGKHRTGDDPANFAVFSQGVIGAATVGLAFHLALALNLGVVVARRAAWLLAVEPLSILYANKVLTETVFTFLMTASVLLLVQYGRRPTTGRIAAAALALALSIYVRPVAYYLPAVVVPLLLSAALLRGAATRVTWPQPLLYLAIVAAAVAPWLARNRALCDYDQICSTADIKLYFVQARAVEGLLRNGRYPSDLNVIDLEAHRQAHPEQANWTRGEQLRWMRREGSQTIRAAPWTYAKIHAWEMLDTLVDNGTMAYLDMFGLVPAATPAVDRPVGMMQRVAAAWQTKPVMVSTYVALTASMLAYLLPAVVGLGALLTRGKQHPWLPRILLLTVLAYLLLVSVGPIGGHRYRVPMMPMFCVLAAWGISPNARRAGGL